MNVVVYRRGFPYFFDKVEIITADDGTISYLGSGREYGADLKCKGDPECYINNIVDITPEDIEKPEIINRIFALIKMILPKWLRLHPEKLNIETLRVIELALKTLLNTVL